MSTTPKRIVDFPPNWHATDEPMGTWAYNCQGGPMCVLTAYLRDDTSLYAMTYPGGQWFARVRRATNWAIEECHTGQPPAEHSLRAAAEAWGEVLAVARATSCVGRLYDPQEVL